MAPKKRQQQKQASKPKNSNKPSSTSSSGPKLQLSAENESRLRRLLLNNSARPAAAPTPADDSLSVAQKAKRLRAVYEKLSCEGFSDDQIEQALSALKVKRMIKSRGNEFSEYLQADLTFALKILLRSDSTGKKS